MIGREKETSELIELYNRKNAELVAIYGRRRVGKTYLVDESFKGRIISGEILRAARRASNEETAPGVLLLADHTGHEERPLS